VVANGCLFSSRFLPNFNDWPPPPSPLIPSSWKRKKKYLNLSIREKTGSYSWFHDSNLSIKGVNVPVHYVIILVKGGGVMTFVPGGEKKGNGDEIRVCVSSHPSHLFSRHLILLLLLSWTCPLSFFLLFLWLSFFPSFLASFLWFDFRFIRQQQTKYDSPQLNLYIPGIIIIFHFFLKLKKKVPFHFPLMMIVWQPKTWCSL
jgi:hypothetical protein